MKPKLPPEVRQEIAMTTQARNRLTKLILELAYERSKLPKPGALAKKHKVSRKTIARIARGEPYRVPSARRPTVPASAQVTPSLGNVG